MCKQTGHKKDKCPTLKADSQIKIPLITSKLRVTLELGDLWGKNSALIVGDLYDIKTEFIDELLHQKNNRYEYIG